MNFPVERKITAGFLAALLVFVALGAVAYGRFLQMDLYDLEVRRAKEVQISLDLVDAAVTEAEFVQRGYLITDDESFLTPLENAEQVIAGEIARMRDLIADPSVQHGLVRLEPMLAERLHLARQFVQIQREKGFESAHGQLSFGTGQALHDSVRGEIEKLRRAESEIAHKGELKARASRRSTMIYLAVGAIVALLWIVGALVLIRRTLRRYHETERALQDSDALKQAILDGADHAFISGNASGITLFNKGAERLLGYNAGEIVGIHTAAVFHDPEEMLMRAKALSEELGKPVPPGMEVILAKARAGGIDEQEWTYIRKDGSRVPVQLTVTAMPGAAGDSMSFLGIARDITKQRRAEEALRETNEWLAVARDRAEAADRIKSAFLATMSHELRTPLNAIIGFTGVLRQEIAGPLNQEQRKQVEIVQKSARHLLALINDVLDISKIEAGELAIKPASFDLRTSIKTVAGIVRPMAESKGLALRVEMPPGVCTVLSDSRRVEQVLLNLLGNAIKFTQHGEVSLTTRLKEEQIEMAIADTGMGIRSDDLATLFQPFRQLDSGLSRNHEGTGLGLAISRRLAELMGGDVGAESRWGSGSVFTFTLPLPSTVPP